MSQRIIKNKYDWTIDLWQEHLQDQVDRATIIVAALRNARYEVNPVIVTDDIEEIVGEIGEAANAWRALEESGSDTMRHHCDSRKAMRAEIPAIAVKLSNGEVA